MEHHLSSCERASCLMAFEVKPCLLGSLKADPSHSAWQNKFCRCSAQDPSILGWFCLQWSTGFLTLLLNYLSSVGISDFLRIHLKLHINLIFVWNCTSKKDFNCVELNVHFLLFIWLDAFLYGTTLRFYCPSVLYTTSKHPKLSTSFKCYIHYLLRYGRWHLVLWLKRLFLTAPRFCRKWSVICSPWSLSHMMTTSFLICEILASDIQ